MVDAPNHDPELDLSPILVRCACFPFEMADPIASPGLTEAADSWLDREADLSSASTGLSEALHLVVPNESDRKKRAQLIALRRALHTSLEPVPRALLDSAVASDAVADHLKSSLMRHAASRLEFGSHLERFNQQYQEALARERAELYSATANEAFRKALYVASPGTLGALARLRSATHKQRQRLEETLHSYLMRAVGRATPNGVWSGVAMYGQSDAHSRVIFAVLLDPFVDAIQAMATRDPWRSEIPLRVNPTLRRDNSAWRFESFRQGVWNSYEVHEHPLLKYARQDLVDAGILLSTLELPRIFSDSWHALELVIPLLPASEQGPWIQCIRNLRTLSEQLGLEYEALALQTLQSGMDTARCLVNDLRARYGLEPISEDYQVLLAQRRVMLSSKLPSDLEVRSIRAIRAYWRFDWFGMGEKRASNQRHVAFGDLPEGGITLRDLAFRNTAKTPPCDEAEYLMHWHNELAPVVHNQRYALSVCESGSPLPPGSGLMLLDAAGNLRVGSIAADPCMFYSRFNPLFRNEGDDDPFCTWYREGIKRTESTFPELLFTDVAFSGRAKMNLAARLNMTGRLLDAADGTGDTLRLYSDSTRWPKLRAGATGTRAIVPRLHSAVQLDGSDPYALAIQQFAFLLGRPSLLCPLPRLAEESETWCHLPRLTLADFSVTPERWTPPQALMDELQSSSGSARYLAWRRYARESNLPDLVYIRSDETDSALLFYSESALAIDILGRRLKKRGGPLLIQEAWPSPRNSWVRDERGLHYATELAVAWHGDEAFWADYLGYTKG